jgi:hypothetical protein
MSDGIRSCSTTAERGNHLHVVPHARQVKSSVSVLRINLVRE